METNLHSAATEFSKSVVKWDQMTFDGNLTTSKPVGQNYLFNHAEGFAQHFPWGIEEHDQIDFSNMASFSQGMMDPSPSTILPSQTLRYPSRQPPAVLATPFLSPVKMTTEISIYDPPKLESAGEAASFNFLLDQPISGCSYAPSDFSAVARDGSIPSSSPRERKGQMGNRVQSMEGIKRRQPETSPGSKYPGRKRHNKIPKIPLELVTKDLTESPSRKTRRNQTCYDDTSLPRNRVPKIRLEVVKPRAEKPHICNLCKIGFDRQEHLTRHNRSDAHRDKQKAHGITVLEPAPQQYRCRFCDKAFGRSDNVKPHEKTHLHADEKARRNTQVSIEESIRRGMWDIDPRINPDLKEAKRRVVHRARPKSKR